MPVGAAVAREPGEHQPEAVEQFRARAESAPDSRDARPLVHGEGGRNIQDFIHICFRGLCHSPSRVGREGLKITP